MVAPTNEATVKVHINNKATNKPGLEGNGSAVNGMHLTRNQRLCRSFRGVAASIGKKTTDITMHHLAMYTIYRKLE